MFEHVKLIKVRGKDAGKVTEVTKQAYEKNKTGVFKDWEIQTDKSVTAPIQAPKQQATKPTLEHVAVAEVEDEFSDYTVKQLKAYAEQEGIAYTDPIKKADLLELIKQHTTKK